MHSVIMGVCQSTLRATTESSLFSCCLCLFYFRLSISHSQSFPSSILPFSICEVVNQDQWLLSNSIKKWIKQYKSVDKRTGILQKTGRAKNKLCIQAQKSDRAAVLLDQYGPVTVCVSSGSWTLWSYQLIGQSLIWLNPWELIVPCCNKQPQYFVLLDYLRKRSYELKG